MRTMYFGMLLCIFFSSCRQKNEKLENALKLAKENRRELEKVLDHYAQDPADSLKLQAAVFLIENMPGHYTLEGGLIDEYREKIFADTIASYFAKKAMDISLSKIDWIRNSSRKKEDVEHIKADFLIRHIDLSFERLNQYPWLKNYPFDLFLEYLLPYRFENERPDLWLDSLHVSQKTLQLFSLGNGHLYMKELTESQKTFEAPFIRKLFHQQIYIECLHTAIKNNFKNRALGFPSAIEYMFHFANRNGYHHWQRLISAEYKSNENIHILGRKAAKVYQRTYSRNPIYYPYKNEYIPEIFRDPFIKDVSYQYLHTTSISIPINDRLNISPHHAYLCVFNNLSWQPEVIGEVYRNKVEFKAIAKNLVYLPVCFEKQKMTTANYPFILNQKGEIEYLIPDTCTRHNIHIKRKYPFNEDLHPYAYSLDLLTIEGDNHLKFQKPDTLLTRLDLSEIIYLQGKINTSKPYRYYRVSAPLQISFAELLFFDSTGNQVKGTVDSTYTKGFDKDPLTNIQIKHNEKVVIDFKSPVNIAQIMCLPRGDGNGIYPENKYELFYHDLNGWQSLGRKTATTCYLEYDNVPKGALLWLRNHTTGVEERIFTYQNHKIKFW